MMTVADAIVVAMGRLVGHELVREARYSPRRGTHPSQAREVAVRELLAAAAKHVGMSRSEMCREVLPRVGGTTAVHAARRVIEYGDRPIWWRIGDGVGDGGGGPTYRQALAWVLNEAAPMAPMAYRARMYAESEWTAGAGAVHGRTGKGGRGAAPGTVSAARAGAA